MNQFNAAEALPTASLLLYIALAFGFSLAANVWIFYRISGGLFNPSVTLGIVLLGKMPPLKGAILVAAQLIGCIFAAGLAEIMLPGDLSVDTTINYSSGISTVQALFLEAFLTFELTLAILMLAVEKVTSYHSAFPLFPSSLLIMTYAAPSNVHGTTWYWSCTFRHPFSWYRLLRSIIEPSTLFRTRSCHSKL